MNNLIRKNLVAYFQASLVLSLLLGCTAGPKSVVSEPQVSHPAHLLGHIELIWKLDDIYTMQGDFEPAIGAADDLVCILGDSSFPPKSVVSCIDSKTRNLAWQKSTGAPAGIIVSPKEVIVSYDGTKGIEKYDRNGKLIWSYPVTGVLYTYVYGDQLQLFMHPDNFRVLKLEDGSVIEELKNQKVIFSTETKRFVKDVNLEAKSKDLSQVFWSVEKGNQIRLRPSVLKDFVFFRTGNTMGPVTAVNQTTGQVLWQTDPNIISNIAYLSQNERVIILSRDGKLLSIDASTGKQEIWAEFSNTPFTLNGEKVVGGYELAYDENAQILYLLLGDSRQLLAFRVD